jgi:hypothetical protein
MAGSGRRVVELLRVRASIFVALLGLLLGLMCRQPARTVVWIGAGLLVVWFYIANLFKQKRYDRMRNQARVDDSVATQARREDLQLQVLRDQARGLASWAIVGVCIAVAGIAVSFSYSAAVRVGIITGSVVCGGWLALIGLTLRRRLRAGPIARLVARIESTDEAARDGDGHLSGGG